MTTPVEMTRIFDEVTLCFRCTGVNAWKMRKGVGAEYQYNLLSRFVKANSERVKDAFAFALEYRKMEAISFFASHGVTVLKKSPKLPPLPQFEEKKVVVVTKKVFHLPKLPQPGPRTHCPPFTSFKVYH